VGELLEGKPHEQFLWGGAGNEPRTSIPRQSFTRQNRVKEQFQLFADRLSTHWLWSNQLRLYLSAFAYVLVDFQLPISCIKKWAGSRRQIE
jgi:hypothetical protein